jgi:4a-hydroxytetrahydrobiopterin dehydratase
MWKEENNTLTREFRFRDLHEAMCFILRVSFMADKLGHYPAWLNSYNYVKIELTTYDGENKSVTSKDYQLRDQIDSVLV